MFLDDLMPTEPQPTLPEEPTVPAGEVDGPTDVPGYGSTEPTPELSVEGE